MYAVEIKNLCKRFSEFTAVDNISLNIREGEIYGLLGPNGAGKSTTIGIICGLLKATSGEMKILGVDTTKSMKGQNKIIGYVPQEISLYEELTAEENLTFFGKLYGLKGENLKSSIDEALEFTGLSDVRDKAPGKFSGGMKRRLNIACAILHKPKIIIMDEPTVGIDPQSRNHILESVKKLNKRGTTIIYTTHYMEEVESICTNISIIDHGKVIANGTKEELKNIISKYKILNVESKYADKIDIEEIKYIKGVKEVKKYEKRLEIHSEMEVNNLTEIIGYFTEKEIAIDNIGYKDINLEEVFLALTGRKLRD